MRKWRMWLASFQIDPFAAERGPGRLRSLQQSFLRIRLGWLLLLTPIVIVIQVLNDGLWPLQLPILSCMALIAATGLVWYATYRSTSARVLETVSAIAVVIDLAVVLANSVDSANATERGAYLGLVLVIVEAASLWLAPGGVIVGAVAAAAAYLRFPRDASANDAVAAIFRSSALVAIGLVVGMLVSALERSRAAVLRQLRAIEVAARFGNDLNDAGMDQVAARFADVVNQQLDLEHAFVAIIDGPAYAFVTRGGPLPSANELGVDWAEIIRWIDTPLRLPGDSTLIPESIRNIMPAGGRYVIVPIGSGRHQYGIAAALSVGNGYEEIATQRVLESLAMECAQYLERDRLTRLANETIADLRAVSEIKDEFLAVTSHELRTPITALRGFVRVLESRSALSDAEYSEAVDAIQRQTRRMQTLIEHLLAASTIDAGRMVPIAEQVVVTRVVDEVIQEVDQLRRGVTVVVDAPQDLPTIECDGSFLRRIISNLVVNAVSYSPPGTEVAVRLTRAQTERKAPALEIAVRDSGSGIAKEDLPKLFGRFERLAKDRARGGSGLGLYIVKGLAEAMGGTVQVTSTLGVGSVFRVLLPLQAPDDHNAVLAEHRSTESR